MNNFKYLDGSYGQFNDEEYEGKYYTLTGFSNPEKALMRANQIFGDDVKLYISNRKNKNYMLLNPETNKYIHFGYLFNEDNTYNDDFKKLYTFKKRNQRFKDREPYSSAYLSYHILW